MAKTTATAAEPKASTENGKETAPPIEINSVGDIASYVEHLARNSAAGANARNYSAKSGFRAMTPLINTNPAVLAIMAGAISSALADQAANKVEGAAEALAMSIQYAENVTVLNANTVKLRSYCETAIDFGYGSAIDSEDAQMDDLDIHQQAKIVSAFLGAQKSAKVDAEFKTWTNDLAKQPA